MIKEKLNLYIDSTYYSDIYNIISILDTNNIKAFLCGGCIRDLLLNRVPKDYDICHEASPAEFLAIFKNSKFECITTGLQHGTITLYNRETKNSFECTTFRDETKVVYEDHRHIKDIKFGTSLEEDLKRRDLTINSFAYNLLTKELIMLDASYLYDLEYGIIRAVGDPKQRFDEDALRMLRAIRFAAQLGFTLDTDTFEAIKEKASTIQFISHERIRDELTKILMSYFPQMLELLSLTGLDRYLNLPITAMINERQYNKYHYTDVFHHTMDVVKAVPADFELRWAAFFHDWGKMETVSTDEEGWDHYYGHPERSASLAAEWMVKYKFDHKSFMNIWNLVKYHDAAIGTNVKMKGMKKLINNLGEELVPKFMKLTFADRLAHRLDNTNFSIENIDAGKKKLISLKLNPPPMKVRDLAVNGNDMIEIGLSGKQIGEALNQCLEEVLENPKQNNKDYLLALIKKNFNIESE